MGWTWCALRGQGFSVTLPRAYVHPIIDNFLTNVERHEQEGVDTEPAVHKFIRGSGREIFHLDWWESDVKHVGILELMGTNWVRYSKMGETDATPGKWLVVELRAKNTRLRWK
ncbi:MAG: hypothetical protein ABI351_05605 [Herbaspirillum sp.]